VSILIVPLQVTGCIDPGRFAGTKKLRAEKKVLPLRVGFDGTVVIDTPPAPKAVVAEFTFGSNVTVASGTGSVIGGMVGMVIVCPVNVTVTGVEPRPVALSTLVNQT